MEEINNTENQQDLIDPNIFQKIDKENRENIWKEETGLDDETICGAIETIVFMSDRRLPIQKIKNLFMRKFL